MRPPSKSLMSWTRNTAERGMTLIEMMTAVVIGGIAVSSIFAATITQMQTYTTQNAKVDMVEYVNTVMKILSRDLRMAGYSPVQGVALAGITYNPTQLLIQADLNGNGIATDPGESIAYSYNSATLALTRSVSPGTQMMFTNVQAFTVTFLDSTGAPTTITANIRQVQVVMTAQTALADPSWPANNGYRTFTNTLLVTPRNIGL